jgi:hypothetical protein
LGIDDIDIDKDTLIDTGTNTDTDIDIAWISPAVNKSGKGLL